MSPPSKLPRPLGTPFSHIDSDEDGGSFCSASTAASQPAPTPPVASVTRSLVKASVAFMLSTAITFCPALRLHFPGNLTHLAAVSTLFFNPCKSVGAMMESVWMGALGMAFALSVTGAGWLATTRLDTAAPAERRQVYQSIVLLALLFVATFALAFVRARSSKPPIYAGAIMSHLFLSITMTDLESMLAADSVYALMWTPALPIVTGMLISFAVNLLLWPTKATSQLKFHVSQSLASSRQLVSLLTSAFLLVRSDGDDADSADDTDAMMANHRESLVLLSRANAEAKLEFFTRFSGTMTANYQPIVASLNRLTQHLGGMHSTVVKEASLLQGQHDDRVRRLMDFVEHVGPTVNRLAQTCHRCLLSATTLLLYRRRHFWLWYWLPTLGGKKSRYAEYVDVIRQIRRLQEDLSAALTEFTDSQREKLLLLYEQEKFDGKPNDQVFLVYFYVFCLVEVAKEIRDGLLGSMFAMHSAKLITSESSSAAIADIMAPDEETPLLSLQGSSLSNESLATARDSPDAADSHYYHYLQSQTNGAYHQFLKSPVVGSVPENSQATSTAPEHSPVPAVSLFLRYRLRLWRFLSDIRHSFELKFALKSALLVVSIAVLGFFPETGDAFRDFRGNWAILSVVVVMTPTVGGTNVAGLYRILGTGVGAAYSVLAWTLFPANPIGLALMMFAFCLPCFYALLYTMYPRVAQVSQVAVCAIVLANYANLNNDQWHFTIFELAWKRAVMVSSGIALGLVVTWYVWPYEARVELRRGVSDLLLNMGILYSRLVDVFNDATSGADNGNSAGKNGSSDRHHQVHPLNITASTVHRYYYTQFHRLSPADTLAYFMSFELKLHVSLMRLKQLLPLTWLEPRLKGPFPVQIYEQMLTRFQKLLDNFVAMRVAISNNISGEAGHSSAHAKLREDLILGIAPATSRPSSKQQQQNRLTTHPQLVPYRRELVGSVLLCFYVYSGSLILKQPLPTYLPPARQTRERLLQRIHAVIAEIEREDGAVPGRGVRIKDDAASTVNRSRTLSASPASIQSPEKYINYYAYALAMEDVINELEAVGDLLKSLFGEMFTDVVAGQDTFNDVKFDKKKSFLSAEQVDIPATHTVHHHRADQWGAQQVTGLLAVRSPSNQPASSTSRNSHHLSVIDHSLTTSSAPQDTSLREHASPRPQLTAQDDESLTDWWRSSGNWML